MNLEDNNFLPPFDRPLDASVGWEEIFATEKEYLVHKYKEIKSKLLKTGKRLTKAEYLRR